MNEDHAPSKNLWNEPVAIIFSVGLALGLTLALPGLGVLGAFAIAIAFVILGRRAGSVQDIGMRSPRSWTRLLVTTFAYGLGIQLAFGLLVEPLLGKLTGQPVDLTSFDGVRGNFGSFLVLFSVGWIVGGFLEELTFRGFVVTRVQKLFGGGPVATWGGVVLSAAVFGLAHLYQGPTGVLSTGLIGFLIGAIYVRHNCGLWYAVFTHGFANSVGIVLIYLDLDRALNQLLF